MKICTTCNEKKPLSEFNFKNKKLGIIHPACKICTRAQSRKYYKKNISAHVARAKKSRSTVVDKYNAFKRSLKCTYCTEDDSVCLEFHHLDPTKKEYSVSKMVGAVGWNLIMSEIEKCVCVCANCHKKIHAGRIIV